jgi:hypothetical protein
MKAVHVNLMILIMLSTRVLNKKKRKNPKKSLLS